jgi:hypothetical protein
MAHKGLEGAMVEESAVVNVERLITAINLQPKLGENTDNNEA